MYIWCFCYNKSFPPLFFKERKISLHSLLTYLCLISVPAPILHVTKTHWRAQPETWEKYWVSHFPSPIPDFTSQVFSSLPTSLLFYHWLWSKPDYLSEGTKQQFPSQPPSVSHLYQTPEWAIWNTSLALSFSCLKSLSGSMSPIGYGPGSYYGMEISSGPGHWGCPSLSLASHCPKLQHIWKADLNGWVVSILR